MATRILLFLMVVRACLSASVSTSYNEIVSIPMPHNIVTDDDTERGTGSIVDDNIKSRALSSVRSDAKSSQVECETDDDCPQNQYCYETNVCAACYECSVYFRHPSTSGCAKNPQMCGSCENGYQNEILSGGKVRDTCTRIPTFQPETIFADSTWISPHMWLFGAFVIVGLLVTIGLLIVWGGRMGKRCVQRLFWRAGNGTYQVYSVPSAPPLPSKDCDINRYCVEEPLVSHYEREDIVATKALPFDPLETPKVVNWQNTTEGNHAQSFGEASGYHHNNNAVGASPPVLVDESTVPSTWTPETLSEGALVTSFAGLFSTGGAANSLSNNNNSINFLPPITEENFAPNSSLGSDANSNSNSNTNTSTGSESGSHTTSSSPNNGGPVHILVQGGLGQSTVQCRVMVNNFQINEY